MNLHIHIATQPHNNAFSPFPKDRFTKHMLRVLKRVSKKLVNMLHSQMQPMRVRQADSLREIGFLIFNSSLVGVKVFGAYQPKKSMSFIKISSAKAKGRKIKPHFYNLKPEFSS